MEIIVLFILLGIFIISGMEIGLAVGCSATLVILFMFESLNMVIIPLRIIAGIARAWPLLSIPMFIMIGEVFIVGGISKRMIDVVNIFVGSISGGLAIVNIVVSYFFGGISGAATADTAAIGGVLIPAMIKEGYDSKFSTVVTITSSTLGPIVPPSLLMIIISWVTELPIGGLFVTGYIPAFFTMLGLILVSYIISKKRNYPRHIRPSFKESVKIIFSTFPVIITPFIIVGGIVFGVATVTEIAAVALLYSIIIGFLYKELKLKDFPEILKKTAITTISVGIILVFVSIFSWIITYTRFPYQMAQLLIFLNVGPSTYMILCCASFLVMGTFLNPASIVLMMMPMLYPIAITMGINPYHFCLISVLALVIGHVTPPLGLCLFIGAAISGDKVEELFVPLLPFIGIMILVILILIFVPEPILLLPRLLGYIS